jgi:protocadherin Fat 1/2/3
MYFSENQVFQFFVRAQDRGSPPLYTNVPVDVYVMGAQDVAPMFERKDENFFSPENSPPGWSFELLLVLVF